MCIRDRHRAPPAVFFSWIYAPFPMALGVVYPIALQIIILFFVFSKGSPTRKDSPGRGRWHIRARRGMAVCEADGEVGQVSTQRLLCTTSPSKPDGFATSPSRRGLGKEATPTAHISGLSSRSTLSSSVPGRLVRQSASRTSRHCSRVRRTSSRSTPTCLLYLSLIQN